jgi:pimeloyl-ACP methyl ester carboxylesterase
LVVRSVIAIVGVVALLLGSAWLLQRRMIYLPSAEPVAEASAVIAGATDVTLLTSDGLRLGAWFVPAQRAVDREAAVLLAPGNAGSRAGRAPLAQALAGRGLSVLLMDYRGYGGNPGSPTEEGLARDVRAARSYLLEEAGYSADRLLYFGESLGTGVVVELATEHPPAGMVLRSPYVDLAALGQEHYPYLPIRLLLRDRFPLRDQLRTLQTPVSVVYGSADSIVPATQSRSVAQAAPALVDEVEIVGADHNDRVLLDGRAVVDAVVRLADRAIQAG